MKGTFLRDVGQGIPIALGYFSVSIGFGLLSGMGGLTPAQAVCISMTNLTSAGQLAGVQVMFAQGGLLQMAVTQLFINLRYALMSIALSQRTSRKTGMAGRALMAFVNTDEIFAVASSQSQELTPGYMFGLSILPYAGWALGTLVGALAGLALPAPIRNGLGIAIYGMFLAIFVPRAKESAPVRLVVLAAVGMRVAFTFVPGLRAVPGGFAIVICALAASVLGAIVHPVKEAAE